MSLLTVVRHGQASFFADDYDQLSELGEKQAQLLGQHWAAMRTPIDDVYVGPRVRQQRTAELVGEVYREAGIAWPQPVILKELDEYDLSGLTNSLVPQLENSNSDFAKLVERHRQSHEPQDRIRYFQRMFEVLLRHWQSMQTDDPAVESWPKFCQRVRDVIRSIQDQPGRSRRVVFFTSGGFVGTAVKLALGTSDDTALELNWRVRNSSVTEFVFTKDRFTLDSFNMISHLTDPDLWTYR